ncbi:MAG TPA: hypothetical protein IAB44_04395 [Candidatus Limivivens intestinipullorum]|uniref:Uncharacterized protein n=1 Tax=Candidatus Limivivens intestinipullorum TaxID=2840858 RepID=A0A9D1ERW4_9FIRM|nr:hypothetical protein [Candidatus Limivivens intestinipullorum]
MIRSSFVAIHSIRKHLLFAAQEDDEPCLRIFCFILQNIILYCDISVFIILWGTRLSMPENVKKRQLFSPGLRARCADRKNVIQECENPIAEGDFKRIFAVTVQQG